MIPGSRRIACVLAACVLATPAMSGFRPVHADGQAQPSALGVTDPFAPVHIVTSRALYQAGIDELAPGARFMRDKLGSEVVVAEIPAHRLDDVSHLVHERERRCGGYFAFATRSEAEAFLRTDGAAVAMRAQALPSYTIDNHGTVAPWLQQVSEPKILATMSTLSSFPNRYYASGHGHAAANWVRDTWLGLSAHRADVAVELFTGCSDCGGQPSVILTIPGVERPDEIVIVGGHLDSISNSGAGDAMIAPGADDDASGIATMTDVIRVALAGNWRPKRTVKFMAYAAEEVGLRGSRAIAQAHAADNADVVGVLQLDMTNYGPGNPMHIRLVTDYSNPPLQQFVAALIDTYLVPAGVTRGSYTCGYACSDHASWTAAGYPSAMVFEPVFFPMLHTTSDTVQQQGNHAMVSAGFARLALAFVGELGKSGRPRAGDFNGDGRSDVLWRHSASGANTIWATADSSTRVPVSTLGTGWKATAIDDFDGDGRADIFWHHDDSRIRIWRSGDAASQLVVQSKGHWALSTGDFNGDGEADLFWRGPTGSNQVWYSADIARGFSTIVVRPEWTVVGTGDFDGDRQDDLVWRNSANGANAIWPSASSQQARGLTGVTNQDWRIAGTGDFDGDGRDDLLWRNIRSGANTIWKAASAANQQRTSALADADWGVEGTGDYDGDGRTDILWRHRRTGANLLWPAGASALQRPLARVGDLAWRIAP